MAKKLLVIEDDKFLRQLITRKLDKKDFNIIEAIDGEKGLDKIKEEKPDLVLLDLILPGMDGFEVLEKAKDNPETSSVPIIILSNLGQKEEIEKGLEMGAKDYLVKAHFTLGEIVEKIEQSLN